MSEPINATTNQAKCPFCGGDAEAGHVVSNSNLQWVAGEYGVWKDLFSGFGTKDLNSWLGAGNSIGTLTSVSHYYLAGIRCNACLRLILELPEGGFDHAKDGQYADKRAKS